MLLLGGDSRVRLGELADCSVDSVVCDPPYELGFMGKGWDASGVAYDVELWGEVLRVLKPGGHLLAFGGSRTYHRLACAVEDAGFEIRDQIMWVYGSGFPKSLDVSKAIDKQAGAEREVIKGGGRSKIGTGRHGKGKSNFSQVIVDPINDKTIKNDLSLPSTDAAKRWSGWGTALKPAHEPVVVARKPLVGTVAGNVLEWGTGAINIDGCRITSNDVIKKMTGAAMLCGSSEGWDRPWKSDPDALARRQERADAAIEKANALGRWPANLIHDGSDEVLTLFPEEKPQSGSAARFFYCAKAGRKERNAGLDNFDGKPIAAKGNGLARTCSTCGSSVLEGCDCPDRTFENPTRANHHPTVKPIQLMRYLCRLVTPPGGLVLDPFLGSGTTGIAATLEGFDFIGIEQDAEYLAIAEARIKHHTPKG